ncbi:PIN2/TERF1-interacting telomerase inhibitor 1 [Haplosporangium sp. Z 27]|nr:PIN2/TERF1-interacting telomerase inhibitor 1 [Haplosporangium sp. Z 27]
MSLKAVRHAKQRLAPDPRNLHWANDTNKFGFKMMEKMGWEQGKGLGAREDGVQEHVKVRLKENNLGVGATKKSIDNWLGNTDAFSKLLEELNERVEKDSQENTSKSNSESESESEDEKKSSKKSKKEAKEKKSKKEKKEKKSKKSKKSSDEDSDNKVSEDKACIAAAITGRKASRHKYLKNKHAAIQNAERLNEILGIKSETASPTTSGMSTPVVPEPMTSTDIFAARMQQNNVKSSEADNEEPARPMFGGLGFATSSGIGSTGFNKTGLRGLGFVKATVSVMPATIETKVEEKVVVESTSETISVVSEAEIVEDKKSKKEKKDKKVKEEKKEKKEKKDKEEKKDKKEKKEKKEKKSKEDKENSSIKKDKKRKAEDTDRSSSKKSKK